MDYDRSLPWNRKVRGEQVLPLINEEVETLRVQAGPGTGKTFGLRRRVLRLLHPTGVGALPGRVLVCAFNRVIRADLAIAIRAEVEPFGLSLPEIQTIHSLCAQAGGRELRFALPHEIEIMIYDLRARYPAMAEKHGGSFYQLRRAVREHQAELKHHPGLASRMKQWLADHDVSMVDDLPRTIEQGIQNGDISLPKFDHVVVDEFQDLTEGEARLVTSLRAEGGTFLALGDAKQSIYAFRGNDAEGLKSLDRLCGQVTDLTMNECQRCPRAVVDLANAVAAEYDENLEYATTEIGQIHQVHHKSPMCLQPTGRALLSGKAKQVEGSASGGFSGGGEGSAVGSGQRV